MNKKRQYSITVACGIFVGLGALYGTGGEIITAVLSGVLITWIGALDWKNARKIANKLEVKMCLKGINEELSDFFDICLKGPFVRLFQGIPRIVKKDLTLKKELCYLGTFIFLTICLLIEVIYLDRVALSPALVNGTELLGLALLVIISFAGSIAINTITILGMFGHLLFAEKMSIMEVSKPHVSHLPLVRFISGWIVLDDNRGAIASVLYMLKISFCNATKALVYPFFYPVVYCCACKQKDRVLCHDYFLVNRGRDCHL